MSDENPLDIKFNIVPVLENLPLEKKSDLTPLPLPEDRAISDFTEARENMLTVLQVGTEAVKELGAIATQAQQPEPYVALAQLIKAVTDGSTRVLQMHKQLEELKNKNNMVTQQTGEVHNNNLFLMSGSTQDLAQALKSIRNE